MAQPLVYQELTISGDGLTAGVFADVPQALLGQYDEFTFYVQFSSGVSAGKFQVKTSFLFPLIGGYPSGGFEPPLASLVWSNVGSTIDWAAASSQKHASVTGVFSALRVYIDTTVVGGTVRIGLVAGAKN